MYRVPSLCRVDTRQRTCLPSAGEETLGKDFVSAGEKTLGKEKFKTHFEIVN